MTEIKKADLAKMIGSEPEGEGIVERDDPLPSREAQWWATSLPAAMAYATTDPASGIKPGTRYDVLMVGHLPEGVEKPTTGFGVVHLDKLPDMELTVTHILYALREGTSRERKARMEKLLARAIGTKAAA